MKTSNKFTQKLVLFFTLAFSINAVSAATLIKSMQDSSKKITVAVFEQIAPIPQQIFTDYAVNVPADFVVIGGGVEGAHLPRGNLVTASYPNAQLSAWLVSTKDHTVAQAIRVKAYAIGLKMEGLTRNQLLDYISVNVATSGWGPYPDVAAGVNPGHVLIGGGIKVNWSGSGNLATANYPENNFSWRVKSKDHSYSSYAIAKAYAIGIQEYIPGIGNISADINVAGSSYTNHLSSSANVRPGFALSGCGAHVNWSGWGNLLWKVKPFTQQSQHGCEAGSKDHTVASPATIDTYAIGIRVQ